MNTIFKMKQLRVALLVYMALSLGACDIPGPWEYDVTDLPLYEGVYASGYIIAGRTIDNICFERLHELNEVSTSAFSFYDSADVQIVTPTGALVLSAQSNSPNCFEDLSSYVPQRAQNYTLQATLYWDSSGTTVTTTLSGVAHIPESFIMKDTARYEYPQLQPPPSDTNQRLLYLMFLDDDVRDSVLSRFGFDPDSIEIPAIDPTTIAQGGGELPPELFTINAFVNQNWDSIYSAIVYYDTTRVRTVSYTRGDTIDYLYGNQNLSSHYYPTQYSEDVGSVLVTHEFSDSANFAETRFSDLLGLGVQAEDLYYSGLIRRLIVYDNNDLPDGTRLFDNVPVINYWFVGGVNRLYLYGLERFYQTYQVTAISNEDDSKVNAVYNIEGARGFFVGGVVDTFDFYIDINPFELNFSREETFLAFCNEGIRWGQSYGGWEGEKDCREFLPEYCVSNNFLFERCGEIMVEENILAGRTDTTLIIFDSIWSLKVDSLNQNLLTLDSTTNQFNEMKSELNAYEKILKDTTLLSRYKIKGVERYCVVHDFPEPTCDSLQVVAYDPLQKSTAQDRLMNLCKDVNWNSELYPQCGPALVVYVDLIEAEGNYSDVLEREADMYCVAHPLEKVCNK